MTLRTGLTASIVALTLASASGSACAMDRPVSEAQRCTVVGGEKLPAEIGGANGVCEAIERAVQAGAPSAAYTVEVRVPRAYMLAATITMGDGRILPEQKLAVSDSKLRRSSLERFAKSLAAEIAKATA